MTNEPQKTSASAARINALVLELWLAVERDGPRYDARIDLTSQQYAVLSRIVADPNITPRGLAESLQVTKGAVSQHLTYLEKEGYLSRHRSDQDGRVQILKLEKRGQEYKAMLERYEQYTVDTYLKKLSPTDIQEVVAALEKLRAAFA